MSDSASSGMPDELLKPVSTGGWATVRRARLVRRRSAVRIAKYVLPVFALALLSSIAVWPELTRTIENGRVTWRRLSSIEAGAGQMLKPRYHGMDGQSRPYTISADTATRAGPERVNLMAPVGDMILGNGTWALVKARQGVFIQHTNILDLSEEVFLYRQDGTTMRSESATVDIKQGAVTSGVFTHAEGPFGTLDAEGFTLVDKGAVVQFHGPAKLVLNASH